MRALVVSVADSELLGHYFKRKAGAFPIGKKQRNERHRECNNATEHRARAEALSIADPTDCLVCVHHNSFLVFPKIVL